MSENQPSARGAKPLLTLILGLILFLFGVAVGYTLSGSKAATPGGKGYEEGYTAAKAEIRAQLEETGLAIPSDQLAILEQEPVLSLSVNITAISGKTLTVIGTLPSFDPLVIPEQKTFTVQITDATKLMRQVELTPEEFDAAFQKFDAEQTAYALTLSEIDAGDPLPFPEPPQPFTDEVMELSDLKVGDTVTINSATDIKTSSSFDADSVSLLDFNDLPLDPGLSPEEIPLEEPPL